MRLFGIKVGSGAPPPADEFGPVCPVCGRYDWPAQPVNIVSCRSGAHRVKGCRCGFVDTRFDCDDH